ncbi:MAG TPA: VWA domain-containing protein [Bryobacteraceae bacterium]|nr:VWA domain-containing protein [Bryobacteraceae bacterium]
MRFLALLLAASLLAQAPPQQNPPRGSAVFSTTTNEVVVNVSVSDANGRPVTTLTRNDFLLYEDGKQQTLLSCDLQHLESRPVATPPQQLKQRAETPAPAPPPEPVASEDRHTKFQDRRLIILFFDFSSMQPPEQIRATEAAIKFLTSQMTASDTVSIMVFGSSLKTVQDFTGDRDLLISTINGFHIGESSELASMADAGADTEDQSGLYVADETEFNIFNTDRKLAALEDATRRLSQYPEKKALVYISGGVEKTGVDNQSQLRATVNAAVRANVAFYPIDARGLTASSPGGDASQAGAVGSSLYSGRGQRALRDSFQNQQETLFTLASDTGGKALLDSNDLTLGITQVQKDIESYYILTYSSTNTAEDGKYRRIQVKLAPRLATLKAKLDYRKGYFAPTTFAHMHESDKEAQLQRALESENPVTDLPLAVEVDYFRLDKAKYFVPVSVEIPGSALSFRKKGAKAATELDFIADVRDARGRTAAVVRDTIPLKLDEATAGQVARKHIQYDTGVTLGPGKYTLRFVARENGEGKAGTFETQFTVPDLAQGTALRLSSVILSNQRGRQTAGVKNQKQLIEQNPLVDSSGQKIVPNVLRIFQPGQDMFVYLELYDPNVPENLPPNVRVTSVAADLALYQGNRKVLETPPVRVNRPDARRTSVIPLHLDVPLKNLEPGKYVCQINVIDELGRKFAFPRTPVVLLGTKAAAAPAAGL